MFLSRPAPGVSVLTGVEVGEAPLTPPGPRTLSPRSCQANEATPPLLHLSVAGCTARLASGGSSLINGIPGSAGSFTPQ